MSRRENEKKKSFGTSALAIHRPVAIIQSDTKKTTSKHVSKNTARGVRNEESQLRAEQIGGEGALRQHPDRTFGQHSEPSPRMCASVAEGRHHREAARVHRGRDTTARLRIISFACDRNPISHDLHSKREEYPTKKQRDVKFEMLNSVETFEPMAESQACARSA